MLCPILWVLARPNKNLGAGRTNARASALRNARSIRYSSHRHAQQVVSSPLSTQSVPTSSSECSFAQYIRGRGREVKVPTPPPPSFPVSAFTKKKEAYDLPSFPITATSEIGEAQSACPKPKPQKEREGDRPEPIFAVSFPGKENLLVLSALIKPRLKSSLSFLFPPAKERRRRRTQSTSSARGRRKKGPLTRVTRKSAYYTTPFCTFFMR